MFRSNFPKIPFLGNNVEKPESIAVSTGTRRCLVVFKKRIQVGRKTASVDFSFFEQNETGEKADEHDGRAA